MISLAISVAMAMGDAARSRTFQSSHRIDRDFAIGIVDGGQGQEKSLHSAGRFPNAGNESERRGGRGCRPAASGRTDGGSVLPLGFSNGANLFCQQRHIERLFENVIEAVFFQLIGICFVFARQADDQRGGIDLIFPQIRGDLDRLAAAEA